MKRNELFLAVIAVLGSATVLGCGDNSRKCGNGTTDNNGVCEGDITCTDGTILNAEGNGCVIDPNSCQDGTVLVDGACVDPGRVETDLEEKMEPNGLGLFGEVSGPEGAGTILIPATGTFVFHGTIAPFQDLVGSFDPNTGMETGDGQPDIDVDTYLIDVTAPVTIDVTADGLHGLAAGFVSLAVVAPGDPLETWQRFGLNLTGDTSQRSIHIPAPGQYLLAVADTRSLFLSGGAAGAAEGEPAFEYYVTVKAQTLNPTPLTVTDGIANTTGNMAPGEVKAFTVPMGLGFNNVSFDMPAEAALESVVITNVSAGTQKIKAVGDGDTGVGTPATAAALGFRTGDTTTIVADHVFNYAQAPIAFDLTVEANDAGALPTDGTSVSQPSDDVNFSTFFYDVGADGEIRGMDISFDRPVAGVVVTEDLFIFSFFTFDPFFGFFFGDTFQDYKGLLRHQTAGRYYFLVFDPAGDTTTDITATSSHAAVQAVAVTKGTPLTAQAVNAFESNPFTYTAGTNVDAWQQFNAIGTGTGNTTLAFFDPQLAFGRLDFLDSTCGNFCDDTFPIFTTSHAQAGTVRGRILLDDGTDTFLVTANTATTTGTPTFDLDFARRDHNDLGTLAAAQTATADNVALGSAATVQRFLVRTNAGNGLVTTVSPDQGTLDTRVQQLNADESNLGAVVNNGIAGADDSSNVIQNGGGWTAFTVTSPTATAGNTFDLTVLATAPVTYTAAASATAYSDACTGGTPVALLPNNDEGATIAINTPAGFDFFGFPAPQIKVFANGFASVDTALACSGNFNCFFGNTLLPTATSPNGLLAPYWDDLDVVSVCQKTQGTKLIIQWEGEVFGVATDIVAFQIIIDGADDTVEFVYDTTQVPTGAGASIGLENQVGSAANQLGFNTAGTITPASSTKFTPN